jgi:hypothetical protein
MNKKTFLYGSVILVLFFTSVFFSTPSAIGKENKRNLQEQIQKKPRKKRVLKSRVYIKGPKGGCYYLNSKGKKVYVSRNLCR